MFFLYYSAVGHGQERFGGEFGRGGGGGGGRGVGWGSRGLKTKIRRERETRVRGEFGLVVRCRLAVR